MLQRLLLIASLLPLKLILGEEPISNAEQKEFSVLLDSLVNDSKEHELLHRSKGLKTAISRKWSKKDFDLAKNFLDGNLNYLSFHLLIALRRVSPEFYQEISKDVKSKILVSALQSSVFYNDWGGLRTEGSFDGEPAKELLELGKTAESLLIPLLDDKSEAQLAGSAEATLSSGLQYRCCDWAFRYLCLINGKIPHFDTEVRKRDADILALKRELESKK